MRPKGYDTMHNVWMASDFDGAFAEYVKVPASEVFPVECDWTDAELGAIPRLRHRREHDPASGIGSGDRVLVTGASGGTGSASVQLAARRGAHVVAMASRSKFDEVRALGAHELVERNEVLEPESCDVVIDNVAGPGFLAALERSDAVDVSSPPALSPARSSISTSAPSTCARHPAHRLHSVGRTRLPESGRLHRTR